MTHQDFERTWWGDCANTYGEETKQLVYAKRMGLRTHYQDGKGPFIDLMFKSVVDLGGGPVSLLLKTTNAGHRLVVDPCAYPAWISARYMRAGIEYHQRRAEYFIPDMPVDECWLYNVLQHVEDPQLIIQRARNAAKVVRIFEWINIPAHEGHPHELKAAALDSWLGGVGSVEQMNEGGCVGTAYYGVFL